MTRSWAVFTVFFGITLALTPRAFAGFDLKLACQLDGIPRGATLAEREIDVEIDEVFRRARILDAVIAEVKPKGVFVDGVGLRKNKVRFGYMIIPKKSRHLRDAASGLNRKRNVFYQFALDRATGRLIFMYEYGQVNPRRVRLKGKCQVRP